MRHGSYRNMLNNAADGCEAQSSAFHRLIHAATMANHQQAAAAIYKECRRNHAAIIGRYALDGCGEFLARGGDGHPKAFVCAACGCHRNFHRKVLIIPTQYPISTELRLSISQPPPPPPAVPVAHSIFCNEEVEMAEPAKKARTRTRFTEEQKEKMTEFAEKLGWRPQRHDEEEVDKFCSEMGVSQAVFKVWLRNTRRLKGIK